MFETKTSLEYVSFFEKVSLLMCMTEYRWRCEPLTLGERLRSTKVERRKLETDLLSFSTPVKVFTNLKESMRKGGEGGECNKGVGQHKTGLADLFAFLSTFVKVSKQEKSVKLTNVCCKNMEECFTWDSIRFAQSA